MAYKSVAALKTAIRDAVHDGLWDAEDEIKDTESVAIETMVYERYDPSIYERRGSSGGLASPQNMQAYPLDYLSMAVANTTPFNPNTSTGISRNKGNELSILIEGGNGAGGYEYDFADHSSDKSFAIPRPYRDYTVELLEQNQVVLRSIQASLMALS